ncbi:carcinoembryonic antigen-related cell adhesion molecule 5-like [Pristis pectinata]|uniref:carcinoembryonic antigen-related cell adhesion molecule 5-like n=1 Tax=Pristis pectinata TaxID=685728 RepID=UPI00223E414D|nr:carcinoembryonic antigen-related cell adhesion molecule 5-like [Pristis pectinata]
MYFTLESSDMNCPHSNRLEMRQQGDISVEVGHFRTQNYIEFPGTDRAQRNVTLTCDVSGRLVSILWKKDYRPLRHSENANLSDGNKTLTITEVNRNDTGNYSCEAEGLLGRKVSKLFQLTVYYGPDEPQIVMSPKESTFHRGSNITLTCKASSFPASKVHWFFNGNSLKDNEEQLIIVNLHRNNTGNYTCETSNSKTNLIKQKSVQVFLSEIDDLEDYGNKSWIAAAVVGVLVIIALGACAFFRNRN